MMKDNDLKYFNKIIRKHNTKENHIVKRKTK
jgi:hypothetical protein